MKARETSTDNLFLLGMILSMTCWGFSWTAGKIISAYGDPLTISFLRFAVTFLSLLIILILIRERLVIERKGLSHLLIAALLISFYTFLFFKGLTEGKAGFGGVLVTVLNPIIAYAIMLILARRRPTRNESLGLLLGFLAGAVLLKITSQAEYVFSAGNIYFLMAAFVWAVLSSFTAKATRYGSSVTFSFWMYGISTVIMMALAGIRSTEAVLEKADFKFYGNLIFSSTITTSLATTFYFAATSKLGASRASSFIFLVPFSAALGSFIFLHERIEWHTIVGGLMGIGAVYILNKK